MQEGTDILGLQDRYEMQINIAEIVETNSSAQARAAIFVPGYKLLIFQTLKEFTFLIILTAQKTRSFDQ